MSKKKWIIIISSIFTIVLLVSIFIGVKALYKKKTLNTQLVQGTFIVANDEEENANDQIKNTEVSNNDKKSGNTLKRNDPIIVDSEIDPQNLNEDNWTDVICLYQDSELTQKVYAAYEYDSYEKKVILRPSNIPEAIIFMSGMPLDKAKKYDHDDNCLFHKSANNDWGNLSEFYMATYYDLSTGEKLDEPIVEHIIKEGELREAPVLNYEITEDGRLSLNWTEVESATDYLICSIEYSEEKGYDNYCSINAVTENNYWKMEASRFGEIGIYNDPGNFKFVLDISGDEEKNETKAICVFAINSDGNSVMSNTILVSDIASEIPFEVDREQWEENGFNSLEQYESYDKIPEYSYITMCDGKTEKRKIIYDVLNANIYNSVYVSWEDDLEEINSEKKSVLKIPYTIEGTTFGGVISIIDFPNSELEEALEYIEDL